jgi:hypothetical protein
MARRGRNVYQLTHDKWSDNCQLTMAKNILIMKTFLGALSICRHFAQHDEHGV